MRKVTAFYCIIVGISMLSIWIMLFVTGAIPELETEPLRIIMHMVAEFLTAILLISSGLGLLKQRTWGYNCYLLSTGALIYTLIQSPGYYMELEELLIVIMFAILFIITLTLLLISLSKRKEYSRKNYYL